MGLPVVPMVIDKDNKFERNYDIFSRLLKDRIVIINGEVNDDMASSTISQLLYLEADNPGKDINMYINSPGGSVSAGLAIIDTMDWITSDVATVCIGQAASMGAMLLSCGTKGKRHVTRYARVMIHQVSSGTRGRVEDMETDVKEARRVNEVLAEILQERCGRSRADIKRGMSKDNWMDADESIKFGIVDQILRRP